MTIPDYPLLTVPGYELYQLAHLTTVGVDALARHRHARAQTDRAQRRAARDLQAERFAPSHAADTPAQACDPLPRPGAAFDAAATALPGPRATAPQSGGATRPAAAPPAAARPATASRPVPARQPDQSI